MKAESPDTNIFGSRDGQEAINGKAQGRSLTQANTTKLGVLPIHAEDIEIERLCSRTSRPAKQLCSRDMKRTLSAIWARRAVRQAYLYTTTTSSSSPEFGASASEAWDGRFRLHKPRGQHLLTNPRVLDAIARHAAINPGDAVLEVGPGTGNLTARLLASQAARVAAVEIDPRMVEAVTARAAGLGVAHKFTVRPPARHSLDRMSQRKSLLTENDGSPSLVFGR